MEETAVIGLGMQKYCVLQTVYKSNYFQPPFFFFICNVCSFISLDINNKTEPRNDGSGLKSYLEYIIALCSQVKYDAYVFPIVFV